MSAVLEIFPSLASISKEYKGVLLDAYGVFWGGNAYGLFPGAKEAMEQCILDGKIVGILSNSTQLASKEIKKLELHGLLQGKHFHFFITSGEVARSLFLSKKLPFATPSQQYWLFGGAHPKYSSHEAIFKDTGYKETLDIHAADFIYLSVPHIQGEDQVDPELFRKEVERVIPKRLPMICPNPDLFAHEGNPPRAVVRQGSIAKIYEEMGGQVFYIGKPHREAYFLAFDQFLKHGIADKQEILMVGDTPETDIRGAKRFGLSSALITQTGIMSDRISRNGQESALKSLALPDTPNYFIGRLADDFHTSSQP